MADYYEVLGITRNATDDEVKRAFRAMARQYHPDSNPDAPDAEAKFKEVSLAYETLRDPERRRRYDVFGEEGARAGGPGPGGTPGEGFGFGDIFDAFFGGDPFGNGRAQAGPPRAPDAEAVVHLDLAQAAFGTTATVDVRLPVSCERCEGSGCEPGTHPARCDVCGGAGEVREVRRSILGQIVTAAPCVACSATGSRIPTPCRECRGDGRVRASRSIDVEVPAGVDDGQRLRLSGRGPAAPRGGVAGDLYVTVRVAVDPRFERAGRRPPPRAHHRLHAGDAGHAPRHRHARGSRGAGRPARHATGSPLPAQGPRGAGAARARSRRPHRAGRRRGSHPTVGRAGRRSCARSPRSAMKTSPPRPRRACSPGSSPRSSSRRGGGRLNGRFRCAVPPSGQRLRCISHSRRGRRDRARLRRSPRRPHHGRRRRRPPPAARPARTRGGDHHRGRRVRSVARLHRRRGRQGTRRSPGAHRSRARTRRCSRASRWRARSPRARSPSSSCRSSPSWAPTAFSSWKPPARSCAGTTTRSASAFERLQRVAREAGAQSRRARVPVVDGPVPATEVASMPGLVLAAVDGVAASALPAPAGGEWVVAVGPEGGFDPDELAAFGHAPRLAVGPFVLRAETAAIAATAALAGRRAFSTPVTIRPQRVVTGVTQ